MSSPAKHGPWLTLALLALLAHLAALEAPFVYDDERLVTFNPSLRGELNLWFVLAYERFRPLTNLSYALDTLLWGQDSWGFHLTGVLLHVGVVLLLHRLLTRGARCHPGGWLACALLAVHPLFVQAVGYVSGRPALLVALFCLLGLLAYRRYVASRHPGWLAAVGGCWALAALSKETGAMLPALLLAYDILILSPPADPALRRRAVRIHLPLFGLLALGGGFRLLLFASQEGGGAQDAAGLSVLTQLGVSWRYVRLFVAPLGQTIVHLVPEVSLTDPGLYLRLGALLALPLAAWRLRRKLPWTAFGLCWYLALLAPTTLIPLDEKIAEQRAYLPGIGLSLVVSSLLVYGAARLLARDPRSRPAVLGATAVWLAGLLGLTQLRYRVWRDVRALWTEAVAQAGLTAHEDPRLRQSPLHAAPYNNLGVSLMDAGELDAAEVAFDRALMIHPAHAEAFANRGAVHRLRGDLEAALRDYERAIDLNPRNAIVLSNRATLYAKLRDDEAALADFDLALELAPTLSPALSGRGDLYRKRGEWERAAADFEAAIAHDPEQAGGWIGRGRLQLERDQLTEALRDLEHGVELEPASAEAHLHLGLVHDRLGALDLAEQGYRTAATLRPRLAQAQFNLAALLASGGKLREALARYDLAIEAAPGDAPTWTNRGRLKIRLGDMRGAFEDLARSAELDPSDPLTWNNMGQVLAETGQHRASLKAYAQAIRADPRYAYAWKNRGLAYEALGEHAAAVQTLLHALELLEPPERAATQEALERCQAALKGQ